MDDGTWSRANKSLRICTESFTYSDILILIDMFKTKFDIKATAQKRKKGVDGWRINISNSQMDKVRNLIKPHMLPEMLYKLGL
jgi:hypothetical protein